MKARVFAWFVGLTALSGCAARPAPYAQPYPPYGAYGYGAPGYAPAGYPAAYPPAAPAPANDAASQAVAFARSRLGTPYCWGGTGPTCYDCSGLTYSAWGAAGKAIPRTSEAQSQKLHAISFAELRPGDIVWRPGHVGLYVGDGWVIHAPGTGKVVTYQEVSRFQKAVRP